MNKIHFLRKDLAALLLFAAVLFTAYTVSAQRINTMTVTTFSGNYIPLIIDPTASTLANIGGSVYYGTYTMPLPFAFSYDNVTYLAGTTIYVRWGHINFGNPLDPNYQNYVGSSSYPNTISPFMGLQVSSPDGTTRIMYKVSGAAPNRIFTIEWYRFGDYPSQASGNVSYQLKLYEGTNQIEFIYEKYNFSVNYANSYYHGTGLNGSASPTFLSVVNVASSFTTPPTNYRFSYPLPIELSVTPKSLVYGPVLGGGSVTLCTTVQHAGTGGVLNFNNAFITGSSDFSIVSAPAGPLNPGQTAQYCVKFSPTGAGARTAILTIVTNGQDSGTQSVALNGTGLYPSIAVDSVTRFKKTRTKLGDSLTQWIHITSTGQVPLFLTSFPFTGIDADQYFISHFPANPIPSGVTDSISITYVPTREGKRVATMTINNNSANLPSIPISLQGTGILPHVVVTPTILLFDSTKEGVQTCKTIDIWNPGSDTLKILQNLLSSNDGDFQYTGLSGTDLNIAPDQHKTVTICFTPLQQGTRQARLLIQTNVPKTFDTPRLDTAGVITIDERGTGVPFGVFANSLSGSGVNDSSFINVQVCRTGTLKNDGDADILVKSIVLTGTDKADFSYSGLPAFPFLLKARSSMTFTVCGTPDKQGILSATATVSGTTGGTTITSDLALGLFGIKACVGATPSPLFETTVLPLNGSDSTLCVTINNCGDIDAIYHVKISGQFAGDYSVTPSVSGNVIAKTGTTQFCVKFKPAAGGTSTASLDVTTDDNSTSVSVPLKGQAGCAVLTNDPPVIPNTGENEKQTFTFKISNSTGTFEWVPGTELFSGTGKDAYKIISIVPPPPIAAGGEAIVTVEFHPPFGSKGTTITAQLTFPSGSPCGNALSIDLNGSSIVSSVAMTSAADGFSLDQSYPNPTQGNANFTYSTPRETEVRIALVDLTGKLIRTLITGRVSEGPHTVNFDARDLTSGTYLYTLESGSTRLVRQFILTK
jgi:hypothetical protein